MADELKMVYGPALDDLQMRRKNTYAQVSELQRQLRELDNLIAGISRIISPTNSVAATSPDVRKYANISVRWAILDLLSTAAAPMATADIAEALRNEGVVTKATNFTNNISAVVSSTMKGVKGEVAQTSDGKWELTDRGRNSIVHIRTSTEFRRRCPWFHMPNAAALGATSPKGGELV
jgi:hypothetical protein